MREGYAEYWVAYDLDYLSGRLHLADPYTDRWVEQYRWVRRARDPAWIFFAPGREAAAGATFSSAAPGPYGYPESLFPAKLAAHGGRARVVRAGVLDAVLPARRVTPAEVGIPPPYWR